MITGARREAMTASMKLQALLTSFIDGKQKIYFCKSMFYFSLPNEGKKNENWLCYFPSTGKVFCFE